MKKNLKNIVLLILLIVAMFFVFRNPMFLAPQVQEITLNEFIEKADNGEIDTTNPLIIKGEDRILEGTFTDGTRFKLNFLTDYDISKLLVEKNIPFKTSFTPSSISFLSN